MTQNLGPRVLQLMIDAGMFTGSMDPMKGIERFTDALIRDCINTASLAEMNKLSISKVMMQMYYQEVDIPEE